MRGGGAGAEGPAGGGLGKQVRDLLRRCCVHGCEGGAHACDRADTPVYPKLTHPGEIASRGPLAPSVLAALEMITGEPAVPAHRVHLLVDGAQAFGAMFGLLEKAQREILVENFIFRGDVVGTVFAATLEARAESGVDVQIVVPARNNHPVVGWTSEHLSGPLLEAGVRVWRWTGPMMHAKTVVMDRC